MTMEENLAIQDFKDKRGMLTFVGVMEIFIAVICLGFFGMSILGALFISQSTHLAGYPGNVGGSMITSILFYLALSVIFIWLGIGSLSGKRWAWALSLILFWYWLITGIFSLIVMIFLFPPILQQSLANAPDGGNIGALVTVFMLGFIFLFFIALPAIFVLLLNNKNVRLTVERYDPRQRWTDKAPLPVIAVCLLMVYNCLAVLFMGFFNWMMPFFGVFLGGISGAVIWIIWGVLSIYLAIQLYRLNERAWWYTVTLYGIFGLSAIITFSQKSFIEMYQHMGLYSDNMAPVFGENVVSDTHILILVIFAFLIFFGFLIYLRRFFLPAETSQKPTG